MGRPNICGQMAEAAQGETSPLRRGSPLPVTCKDLAVGQLFPQRLDVGVGVGGARASVNDSWELMGPVRPGLLKLGLKEELPAFPATEI
jgi:hypothetical protein